MDIIRLLFEEGNPVGSFLWNLWVFVQKRSSSSR